MNAKIIQNLSKWGGPMAVWRNARAFRNKQLDPPFKTDSPEFCLLGSQYWNNYPIQNYQYNFNSWGFRDDDFDQYRKEVYPNKVNICIGDSFTINFGGPKEHGWVHLLSKRFQNPTLNIAIDSLLHHEFSLVVKKCFEWFNVDKIFVLYNLFDDLELHNIIEKQIFSPATDIGIRSNFLKNHCWIPNAYWQFVPPWLYNQAELKYLYKEFPQAHEYLKLFNPQWQHVDYNSAVSSDYLNEQYQKIQGPNWPSYYEFVKLLIVDHAAVWKIFTKKVDRDLIKEFLFVHMTTLLTRNRDGRHMSLAIHQALADYFYQQSTGIKLI